MRIPKLSLLRWQAYLLYILLLIFHRAGSQPLKKFSSSTYGVREGLLSGRVLDMAADGHGLLWISTGVGLQRFDGKNFETIPGQAGLPQTTQLSFFGLNDGGLWIRDDNGISSYDIKTDKFRRIAEDPENSAGKGIATGRLLLPVMETVQGVWCFNTLTKAFICISKSSGRPIENLAVPVNLRPAGISFVKGKDGCVIYVTAGGLLVEISLNLKRILYVCKAKLPWRSFAACIAVSQTEVIVAGNGAISKVDLRSGEVRFTTLYPRLAAKLIQNLSLTASPTGGLIMSLNNQLFALDETKGTVRYQLVDQQNGFFTDPAYVIKCLSDKFDHLWIVSTTAGLVKVSFNTLGIKYYGYGKLADNFNRCIYPDPQANTVIAGSLIHGFSVFDTTQHLLRHFELRDNEQTSCILKIRPYRYLLFTIGSPGAYILNTQKMQLHTLQASPNMPSGMLYQTYAQRLSDSTAILFCNLSYVIVNFSKSKIRFIKGTLDEEFSAAACDHQNRIWLGQTGKYMILSGKGFAVKKTFNLPEKVKIQCLMEDRLGGMWIGTEKGLYRAAAQEGTIQAGYGQKDGLTNDCIYSVTSDDRDNIWCGTNKGISGVYRSGKILNIHLADGLQGDEFNTNSCAKAADGELFFGGICGVSSFFPDSMDKVSIQPGVLMTEIKVMDTRLNIAPAFKPSELSLPYSSNTVSFSFTAIGRYSPDEYHYQYKMTGIDKAWVNGGNNGYARYVLPPGNYTFEYTAGNAQARNLQHTQFVFIRINPPFWHTVWFYGLIAAIALTLIIISLKLYNRSVRQKSLQQLALRQSLQQERQRIARDLHDHIGAYATVVMSGAEHLIGDSSPLKFRTHAANIAENARNIMTSLHETIWVLDNEAITITDFSDRFKLYAKKACRHAKCVKLMFHENLPVDLTLGPAESLNLFRIMQEALQNALKHADARNITITLDSSAALFVSVMDDGGGFDPDAPQEGNGLGNMHHRAKESGYVLRVLSGLQGTNISLQKGLPYGS